MADRQTNLQDQFLNVVSAIKRDLPIKFGWVGANEPQAEMAG